MNLSNPTEINDKIENSTHQNPLMSCLGWQGSKEGWLKEILTKIAEVLKLQDLPAIQMQVVSLGTAFPDLR